MTPSVSVKVTVKTPACVSLGVQVKVPDGEVPWDAENVAPAGSCDALIAKDGAGRDESVPETVKVTAVSSLTVSVEGTFSDIVP